MRTTAGIPVSAAAVSLLIGSSTWLATAVAQPSTPASEYRLIFESWKVIDGRIRQIEATVFSVPYKMHPGWPAN